MDKIATENLFLLEFLVDRVNLSKKCECDAPPGETCVSFKFLDNAPLDVCETDFNPRRNYRRDDDTSTKSGKSCLFSLSPTQAETCLKTFDITVTIWKKMTPGWLPEKVEIGSALISIANLFSELINSVQASDGSVPTAKTLKDEFEVTNDRDDKLGKISVYIRLSCFGKLIITQFQMNLEEKSVLFKDKEGKSLYKYKKSGRGDTQDSYGGAQGGYGGAQGGYGGAQGGYNMQCPTNPCGRGQMPGQYGGGMGGPPGMGGNPYGGGGGGYNTGCPTTPCGRGNMPGGPPGGMGGNPYGGMGGMGGMGGSPYGGGGGGGGRYNTGCPKTPCGGMAGASPGGGSPGYNAGCPKTPCGRDNGPGYNAGCPKTPCGKGNGGDSPIEGGQAAGGQRQVPCSECGALPNPPCLPQDKKNGNGAMGGGAGKMTPCQECGALPNPPCIAPGGGGGAGKMTPCQECGALPNPPCLPPGGGANRTTPCAECGSMPNPPCLPPGAGDTGGGGRGGLTPCQECGGLPNPPCGTGTCGGSTPCAECAGNPDAPCLNMGPTDYCPGPPEETEVFVLKIGKKKEGTDKKPRMELELVTPKAPVVKPIPKKETRETQYDPQDINGKKGKNGKGKKKK